MYMRAREFVLESHIVKNGTKPRPDAERALPAAHRVAGTADRHYDLNRIMMSVAASDHTRGVPVPVQSWAGKNNIATPYTKAESDMLKRAYEAMGAEWDDALAPNPHDLSLELDEINRQSPVARRKTNKFGV